MGSRKFFPDLSKPLQLGYLLFGFGGLARILRGALGAVPGVNDRRPLVLALVANPGTFTGLNTEVCQIRLSEFTSLPP
jgi:hypothetical protein